MSSNAPVEIADRISRKRPVLIAVAALFFLAIQLGSRPVFVAGGGRPIQVIGWAITAGALLGMLAIGGGLLNARQLQALINDEVSRANSRTAIVAGFWVAMLIAMILYAVPLSRGLTARDAVYLIVTAATGVALLDFAFLEYRATR
jgi:protein-S-isoprenylcysteine O-methyltransferase Ste14